MKKEIIFNKRMYLGYPVIVVVFWDTVNERFSATTLSSVYNLGKMLVLGVGKNNFYNCILSTKQFTINILPFKFLDEVLKFSVSGTTNDKLLNSNLTINKKVLNGKTIAYFEEAVLIYNCCYKETFISEEYDLYANLICNIDNVYADECIIKDEIINPDLYDLTIFVGTDYGRYFKDTSKNSNN